MLNKPLIFRLSLFGLVMAIATVFWIPGNIEIFFWIPIFIYCAYVVAKKAPGKYFLHGFLVSLLNCVWVTSAHVIFYSTYVSHHTEEISMMRTMSLYPDHPRRMMLLVGPVFGIIFGLILGLFSFIAGKVVKK
jgi:hypothetical protein